MGLRAVCEDRSHSKEVVVYCFSQMCALSLYLCVLITGLLVPLPHGVWGQCSCDPLSPCLDLILGHQVSSIRVTPLTSLPTIPYLLLNVFTLSPPPQNLFCSEVPGLCGFPSAGLLPYLGTVRCSEGFSGRQGLRGAVPDQTWQDWVSCAPVGLSRCCAHGLVGGGQQGRACFPAWFVQGRPPLGACSQPEGCSDAFQQGSTHKSTALLSRFPVSSVHLLPENTKWKIPETNSS